MAALAATAITRAARKGYVAQSTPMSAWIGVEKSIKHCCHASSIQALHFRCFLLLFLRFNTADVCVRVIQHVPNFNRPIYISSVSIEPSR